MSHLLNAGWRWSLSLLLAAAVSSVQGAAGPDPAAVLPQVVTVEHPEKADPESDCRAALKAGDDRFFMMPPAPSSPDDYPGVPAYAEHLVKEKGIKVIKALEDGAGTSLYLLAARYADRYNRFLLKQIPGSDQPEPGYGIPKPDDIVSKGGELTTGTIAQGRDLSRYDDGGNCAYNRYLRPATQTNLCNFPRVRAFIWHHWQEKKRGYIRVSESGIDTGGTSHLFIEPDAQGIWHIARRWVGSRGRSRPGQVLDDPLIASVKRVRHEKSDRPGGSYVLSFRGADGSELGRL